MRGLKVISLFSHILAEVGFTDLASVEYKDANMTVAPLSVLGKDSLAEGVLLYQTGTLHNIRFYSPYVKRAFEEITSWYKADPVHDSPDLTSGRSTDPAVMEKEKLAYVLCRLFPSQTGSISIVANNPKNLAYVLTTLLTEQDKKDHKDLKMLAGILFCLVHRESVGGVFSGGKGILKFELSRNATTVEYTARLTDKGSAGIWADRLCMLQALINVKNDPTDRTFDSRTVFKAFLAIYLKDRASLKHFYEEYFTLFKQLGIKLPINNDVEEDKIMRILTSVENELSRFPYRPNSAPPYRSMPFYLGDDQFNTSETFSTCSESALYHLCNCVLWDADKKAYISVTDENNNTSVLSEGIFKGDKKGIPDYTEMTKWHKLIENLPDGVCSNKEGPVTYDYIKLSSKKVFYAREYSYRENTIAKNEVEPGLINFIRLLEILTSNDNLVSKILPIFIIDENNNIDIVKTTLALKTHALCEYIKEIFRVIVGAKHIEHFTFAFQNARLINCNGRYDIYGSLEITRKYPGIDISISYSLSLHPGHAELLVHNSTAKPATIDENAVASFLDDCEYSMDLRLALYTHLSSYLVNKGRFSDFMAKANAGMTELGHRYLIRQKIGPDAGSKHLINTLLTFVYKDKPTDDEIQSNILRSVEHFLKSIPIDDEATFKRFSLATFLLRDRLRTVPIVTADDGKYMGDELFNGIKRTNYSAWVFATYLKGLFEQISQICAESTVAGSPGLARDTLAWSSVKFGSLQLSEKLRGMFKGFAEETTSRILLISSLGHGSTHDLLGLLNNAIHLLHAYNFFTGKIEREETLTRHEYFHFLETIFSDGNQMLGDLSNLVLNDYRTLQSIDELRSQDSCLFDALQILAYARRGELSKCKAVVRADSPQSIFVLGMLLLYDTFLANLGVKGYILEKQESPAAKDHVMEVYKDYLADICRTLREAQCVFAGGAFSNRAVFFFNALRSYISIFLTNQIAMDMAQLQWLVEGQKTLFEEAKCALTPAERAKCIHLLKLTLRLLYEYLSSEVVDLWRDDQDEGCMGRRVLDHVLNQGSEEFFVLSGLFLQGISTYIEGKRIGN